MILQQLPAFNPQTAGQKALLKVPKYDLTLSRVQLRLGGTFTKAQIDQITVRAGSHPIYDVTGSDLDAMNKYKGIFDDAYHLTLDWNERDASDIVGKEIGGIDMTQLNDELFIEVSINAGATSPTLSAKAFFTPPQGNNLIKKILKIMTPSLAAGRNDIPFNPMGALIQRVFIKYGGTDWTTSADGNVKDLRVVKNGVPICDDIGCLDNRFVQQEYRKVPQTKMYVYDAIVDNNQSGAVVTSDAKSLQIRPNLTATDTLTCYFEVIDTPYNL